MSAFLILVRENKHPFVLYFWLQKTGRYAVHPWEMGAMKFCLVTDLFFFLYLRHWRKREKRCSITWIGNGLIIEDVLK